MEKILLIQNKHWKGEKYSGLIQRHILNTLLKKLRIKEVLVLLGIRRSGKSSIFKLLINHLSDKIDPAKILYLNIDDPFFSEVCKDSKLLYSVIETAEKLTRSKIEYLFLDEVQNIKDWEKFVKSVYDAEHFAKIFITGSNSSLLKGTYARLLSGRYVSDYVYPFSLKEILEHNGITTSKDLVEKSPMILRLVEDMIAYGSFPEVWKIQDPELKREVLINYYETVVLKDCIANNAIRDIKTFKELAFFLISNVTSMFSYNSLAKAIQSNENTVKEFIHVLEGSFLFREIRNFSYKLKLQSKGKKKCYCIDNGFINAVSFMFSENKGRLFENLVFTEFLKNGYREIFFYNEHKECDFIFKRGKDLIAVQATYELNISNRKREIGGLTAALHKLNIPKGFVITFNTEEKIDEKVSIVPFWKIHEQK